MERHTTSWGHLSQVNTPLSHFRLAQQLIALLWSAFLESDVYTGASGRLWKLRSLSPRPIWEVVPDPLKGRLSVSLGKLP